MSVPKRVMERIERYVERYGISKDELLAELHENFELAKDEYPKYNNTQLWMVAVRKLGARLIMEEGSPFSRATPYVAFFFGETGLRDASERVKRKILRMPEAEQLKYHPDEDTWIDYKTGRILESPMWVRTLYGIGCPGRELDFDRCVVVKLEAWRDVAESLEYSPYTWYRFRAIRKDDKATMSSMYLGATSVTKFRALDVNMDEFEVAEELYKLKESNKIKVYEAQDVELLKETWDPSNDPVFVEAEVGQVIIREGKSNLVQLVDNKREFGPVIVGYVPKYLKIDFKAGQTVWFYTTFGTVTLSNKEKRKAAFIKGFITFPMGMEV